MVRFWTFGGSKEKKKSVFGVPLQDVVDKQIQEGQPSIPHVVIRCVQYLCENGLKVEGLFRIPPDASVVEKYKNMVEERPSLDFTTFKDVGPHVVGGLLKSYIKALPDPLLTFDRYHFFKQALSLPDRAMVIPALRSLIDGIPPANNMLLRYLIAFLLELSLHVKDTQMGSANLAGAFTSNILRAAGIEQGSVGELADVQSVTMLMQILIEHYPVIFRETHSAALQRLPQPAAAAPQASTAFSPPIPGMATPGFNASTAATAAAPSGSQPVPASPFGSSGVPPSPFGSSVPPSPFQQQPQRFPSAAPLPQQQWYEPKPIPAGFGASYGSGGGWPAQGQPSAQMSSGLQGAQPGQPGTQPTTPRSGFIPVPSTTPAAPAAGTFASRFPSSAPQFRLQDNVDMRHGSLVPMPFTHAMSSAVVPADNTGQRDSGAFISVPMPPSHSVQQQAPAVHFAAPPPPMPGSDDDNFKSPEDFDVEDIVREREEAIQQQMQKLHDQQMTAANRPFGAPHEQEQIYEQKHQVLVAQQDLRKQIEKKEQAWEKERKQLQKEVADLKAAWSSDRASLMHSSGSDNAANFALQRELDTLRGQYTQVLLENEKLHQRIEALQGVPVSLSGHQQSTTAILDKLRIADENAQELIKMLAAAPATAASMIRPEASARPQVAGRPTQQ